MNRTGLAESIIATSNWSHLMAANGSGEPIRAALAALLAADTPDVADAASWRIENHAVVQGELFEVSEACVSVLVAALADPRPFWVRISILDLLFQFLSGGGSPTPGTPVDIRERCERAAREGLWLLCREAMVGAREAALDVIDLLGEGARVRNLLDDGETDLGPDGGTDPGDRGSGETGETDRH